MYKKIFLFKFLSIFMLALCVASIPAVYKAEPAYAAKKKSLSKKTSASSKSTFSLDKYIKAHENDDRNTIHQQLVALKGDFRRTFNIQGTSNVNLLMLACRFASDVNSIDAIATLIGNCPDLINAKDSKGQTAIFYSLVNEYTLPFEILMEDPRTQVNIVESRGVTPIQLLVTVWGAMYQNEEQAILAMLNRGVSLIYEGGGFPSAIDTMLQRNDPLAQKFLPVAQQQYQNYLSTQR